MGKRIILVTAIVLGFVSPILAADPDPNLVGWWKLDGDALDASGNGRHGTLMGDTAFIEGVYGQALTFDGSGDYVNIDGYKGICAVDGVQRPFTIANWFRTTFASGDREMVTWGTNVGRQRLTWRVYTGMLRTEHGSGNIIGTTLCNDGEWHHGALVVNEGAALRVPQTLLYLDGKEESISAGGSDNTYLITEGVDVRIGMGGPNNGRYWLGDIDDVRIYDRPLTAEEIAALAKRPKSYAGDPANGSLVEAPFVLLQWRPGGFAVQHSVYFGTTPDLGPAELMAAQTDTSFVATNLAEEHTYYWRIDDVELDGTVHTGDVWSFWVPPQRAYQPQPADGFINAGTDVQLSWTGGWSPLMHTVYLGTDKDQVAAAAGGMPQMEYTYNPGPLATDTTYYWRVDEFYAGQWIAGPVWSFATVPEIPMAEDPNLVVSWTFEEPAGLTALDMSGHGHHGTFMGSPERAQSCSGMGLLLGPATERDYVVHSLPQAESWSACTVAAWVKASSVAQAQYRSVFASHLPNTAGLQIDVDGTDPGLYRVNPPGGTTLGFGPVTTEWVHLVLTCENTVATTYYNGTAATVGTLDATNTTFNQFAVGINRNGDNFFEGIIDEFRVYDKALTAQEVDQLFDEVSATVPMATISPAASVESTGDDGMVLAIDGAVVTDLVLGVTSTDFEKYPDHPAPHADDFDLKTYASLDDSTFITTTFAVPVRTIFIIERGANDRGSIQLLDAAGQPVGAVQPFATTDWFKPGVKVNGQEAGAMVIASRVPISAVKFLPPADAPMGLDPASVSAIPAP